MGSTVRLAFPDAAGIVQVELTDPAGKTHALKSERLPQSNVAAFEGTARPGIYTWKAEGSERREGGFAVNPDPRESDLQQGGEGDVAAACRPEKLFIVSTDRELRDVLRRLREGLPLIDYFILAVLAIAIFECFFSNWLVPDTPREVKKSNLGLVTSNVKQEI